MKCNICPRQCNVDRTTGKGVCNSGDLPTIYAIAPHYYEEPPISGHCGSGTIFFGGCNLNCRYCQNHAISRGGGVSVTVQQLADIMLYLQHNNVHNINLVTPTHYTTQVVKALQLAKPYLTIPVVYNSSGYDSVDSLRLLEGLVDIYLPDFKYCSSELSANLSQASDYFDVASKAIVEMLRQQPVNVYSDNLLQQGVIVRHLVLPMQSEDSKQVLDYLASIDSNITVSIMSQYFPTHNDNVYPYLNRTLTSRQYDKVVQYAQIVGLTNIFVQQLESNSDSYVPQFDINKVQNILDSMDKICKTL